MTVLEISTGKEVQVFIERLNETELKNIGKKRYFFDWKELYKTVDIYKLQPFNSDDIKGLMGLIDYPQEQRIEVKLLAVSIENVIRKKEKDKKVKVYNNIAGNLLAYAARVAILKYGVNACVSLVPKTTLKIHYMKTYGMIDGGLSLYLELDSLQDLIIKYKI